jgi:hypothetical protein
MLHVAEKYASKKGTTPELGLGYGNYSKHYIVAFQVSRALYKAMPCACLAQALMALLTGERLKSLDCVVVWDGLRR